MSEVNKWLDSLIQAIDMDHKVEFRQLERNQQQTVDRLQRSINAIKDEIRLAMRLISGVAEQTGLTPDSVRASLENDLEAWIKKDFRPSADFGTGKRQTNKEEPVSQRAVMHLYRDRENGFVVLAARYDASWVSDPYALLPNDFDWDLSWRMDEGIWLELILRNGPRDCFIRLRKDCPPGFLILSRECGLELISESKFHQRYEVIKEPEPRIGEEERVSNKSIPWCNTKSPERSRFDFFVERGSFSRKRIVQAVQIRSDWFTRATADMAPEGLTISYPEPYRLLVEFNGKDMTLWSGSAGSMLVWDPVTETFEFWTKALFDRTYDRLIVPFIPKI